ncbi:hypothetical protein [uncultured Dysosmobacter sp.]|uniref:hypothetical protein n=1 Tax=uncultured Dysosmobacter sp. TaxID=2591384 RepID=UPI0026188146|nr:hypothetical protein [uncultured Dysosmobacter sp.]
MIKSCFSGKGHNPSVFWQAKQLQILVPASAKNGISESSRKGKRKDDEKSQKKVAIIRAGTSDGILHAGQQLTTIGPCPTGR